MMQSKRSSMIKSLFITLILEMGLKYSRFFVNYSNIAHKEIIVAVELSRVCCQNNC